jgi:Zn-dependent protease with chaperone function
MVSTAVALAVHLVLGGTFEEERVGQDARVLDELRAVAPDAVADLEEARRLDESGAPADLKRALQLLRGVTHRVPTFPHAIRRTCAVQSQLGRKDDALVCLRDLMTTDPSPETRMALALALVDVAQGSEVPKGDAAEAWFLAAEAMRVAPGSATIALGAATVAQRIGRTDRLVETTTRLLKLAPDEVESWRLAALAKAEDGRYDEALAHLEQARTRGLAEAQYGELWRDIVLAKPFYYDWRWRVLGGVSVWVGVGLTLLLLTALFGRLTFNEVARGGPVVTHEAPTLVAVSRAIYRVLLRLCCLLYLLSLPVVGLVLLAAAVATVRGFWGSGLVPPGAAITALVLTFVGAWTLVSSLLVRVQDDEPGIRLSLGEHPGLEGVLVRVAAAVGTRRVDAAFLTPDAELAIHTRGGVGRLLRGAGERCLVLGAGVLEGLGVRELEAVLAHEYGLLDDRATAGGGFALAIRRALASASTVLVRGGSAAWYNPAWPVLATFQRLFQRVSHGATRLQELLADQRAAYAWGSASYARALVRVIEVDLSFDARTEAVLDDAMAGRQALVNLYRATPTVAPDAAELARKLEGVLHRPASPGESRPPVDERLRRVEGLGAPDAAPTIRDAERAWTLLTRRDVLELELTERVRAGVEARLGVMLPKTEKEAREMRLRRNTVSR